MSKVFLKNIIFFICLFILAACNNNLDYVYESKKVIRLTIWANEQSQNSLDNLMTNFKKIYPDINFEISLDIVEQNNIFEKLESKPKYKPDVFIFDNDLHNNLVNNEYMIDSYKLSDNNSIGVYSKTKHKKEAILLAKWLSNNFD